MYDNGLITQVLLETEEEDFAGAMKFASEEFREEIFKSILPEAREKYLKKIQESTSSKEDSVRLLRDFKDKLETYRFS